MELMDLNDLRARRRDSLLSRMPQRRNRQFRSTYREPLLNGESSFPTSLSDAPDQSYRSEHSHVLRYSVGGGFGPMAAGLLRGDRRTPVPPTGVPTYHPPLPFSEGTSVIEQEKEFLYHDDDLYISGPAPPSLSRALRRQTPTQTASSSLSLPSPTTTSDYLTLINAENPAKDLGGILSYGFFCLQCVRTQEVGIIEDMGQFDQLLEPGLYCMMWPFSDIAGRLSLRIQQIDVVCETKTKDNVFVHLSVAIQFRIIAQKAYDAYYRLTDPRTQIKSYVFDVVRSTVPRMSIDEAFASKATVAATVLERLHGRMYDYGYEIVQTLVTNISPDALIKASMNEINASKRLKEAILYKAEAGELSCLISFTMRLGLFCEGLIQHTSSIHTTPFLAFEEKIQKVKAAEASAEASYLSGIGIANERKALARGLKESVSQFPSGASSDVMDLLLLSQYIDTLSAIGCDKIAIRPCPGEVFDLQKQLHVSTHIHAKQENDLLTFSPQTQSTQI